MPRLHAEALLFCLAWLALAIAAAMASIWLGMLFSGGLAILLMPLSATIIAKTENLALERQVRRLLDPFVDGKAAAKGSAETGEVKLPAAAIS